MGRLRRTALWALTAWGCSLGPETFAPPPGPPAPTLRTTPSSPGGTLKPSLSGDAVSDAQVRVYAAPDCTGAPLLTLSAAELAQGVEVDIVQGAVNVFTAVAATAVGASACSAPLVYRFDPSLRPDAPVLQSTRPESPATSRRPLVFGRAPRDARVRLYASSGCLGQPLVEVSSVGLEQGVVVTVDANTLTELTADAFDGAGATSACSAPLEYEHDDKPPAPPVISESIPPSPGSSIQPILVLRSLDPTVVQVQLYPWPDCPGFGYWQLACGGLCETRLMVPVAWNRKTVYSAKAVDRVGNVSECGPNFAYVQDPWASIETPTFEVPRAVGTAAGMVWEIYFGSQLGTRTDFYDNSACAGPPFTSVAAFDTPLMAFPDKELLPFTLSARSFQGPNQSHCSAPLVWP